MALFDIFRFKKFRARAELAEKRLKELGYQEYTETKAAIEQMQRESELKIKRNEATAYLQLNVLNKNIADTNSVLSQLTDRKIELQQSCEKTEKQVLTNTRKINKLKELYRAVEHCLSEHDRTLNSSYGTEYIKSKLLEGADKESFDELAPTVTLKLHCMDMRDLKKAYRDNEKQITSVVERYKGRYTTKANQTIYDLMVIALRAEIQNILYSLKYEKLDASIDNVKAVTAKYLAIATNGNQSIASTVTKFIGEIEYLFINAVKIEYNYYVKREQAKEEQRALREQMRQEAEERKALELERKRIEAEEKKYEIEIEHLKEKMEAASEEEKEIIKSEIIKIESNLSDVVLKKDEISKLEHGKAGYIYIISNLGSFGDNMFKIGMTRRMEPQDRVDELGSASVPFRFDVHSFIFSEDAVTLENELHKRLNDKRVNKVNLRKEFFYSTVDELEALTNEISPAAEFNKTMLAEEFRQSLSTDDNYTSELSLDDEDEE